MALSPAVVSIALCTCGHGQHRHADDGCTGHVGDCTCARFDMADPVVVDVRGGLPRADAPGLYTASQLIDLTGATYRQVDYWTRTDRLRPLIPAIGSGSQRRYSANDVRLAYAVVRLLDLGFGLKLAFDVAGALVNQGRWACTAGRLFLSVALTGGEL